MKTLTMLAAFAAASLATPAIAQAVPQPATVAIHVADLDLATPAGQRRLDLRIGRAARWACGDISTVDLAGQNRARNCRDAIVIKLAPARLAAIRGTGGVKLAEAR